MTPVNSGCGYSFTKGLGDLIKYHRLYIYIYNIQYTYIYIYIYNIQIYRYIYIYIWKTCWKIDGIYGICQWIRVINRLRLGFTPALLRWYPDETTWHMKPWWLRIMIPQLGLQKCTLELWTISQMILHTYFGDNLKSRQLLPYILLWPCLVMFFSSFLGDSQFNMGKFGFVCCFVTRSLVLSEWIS